MGKRFPPNDPNGVKVYSCKVAKFGLPAAISKGDRLTTPTRGLAWTSPELLTDNAAKRATRDNEVSAAINLTAVFYARL